MVYIQVFKGRITSFKGVWLKLEYKISNDIWNQLNTKFMYFLGNKIRC